jgi:hypothetical protein
MKNISLLILAVVLVSCGSTKKMEPTAKVDETQWPVKKRLHKQYYDGLYTCLTNPTTDNVSHVSKCLGGNFILNVSDNRKASELGINTIKQWSYEETEDISHTVLLLNETDSLFLEIDYDNCIMCKVKPTSFSMYYRSSNVKSSILSGQGF